MSAILRCIRRAHLRVLCLAIALCGVSPLQSLAQTSLSNTPVMEADIAHLFTSRKPLLYFCQTGILDDIGNLDGGWGEPPSPGRIVSAAWDIGGNRYLYAYQLSNPNWIEGNGDFNGGWDVALDGFSTFRIPLGRKHIIPVDFNGDNVLDTSFHTMDHACDALEDQPNPSCTPFTGPFSVFTAGTSNCGRSWSDYYIDYGGVSNDAIVSGYVDNSQSTGGAHFRVQYDPYCCAYGIFRSTQVFGFVTDAPPDTVSGIFLGGASASVQIVAPVVKVLLVEGICGDVNDWGTFEAALVDSEFAVARVQYAGPFYSQRPSDYVDELATALNGMGPGRVAVVAHSMGGLIAREYMRKMGSKGRIAQLVTLGTPHHGSDLLGQILNWWPLFQWAVGVVLQDPCLSHPLSRPALVDMKPGSPFLNRLNYGQLIDTPRSHGWDTHPPETGLPANVYLASIAGTGTFCKPLLRDGFWKKRGVYHPNDCTVATGGSLLVNTSTFRAADPALALEKPAAHTTAETAPCGEAYYRFRTLGHRVAHILLASPAGLPLSSEDNQPDLQTGGVSDDEDEFQTAPPIADSVLAGQIVNKTVAIPATSEARFSLLSTDARLSLLDPNGAAITVNDTSATSGISFFATDDGGFVGFEIAAPLAGTWTMRIDASASAAGQRVGGIVQYTSESVAELSVAAAVLHPGDVMQVRGQLVTGVALRTDAIWNCSVVQPDGASTPLALYDDGAHDDSLTADGIYGNTIAPSGGVGLYSVIGSASAPGAGPLAAVAFCEVADTQDLVVQPLDISLSRNLPNAGDSLTVYSTIHNNSSKPAMGVTVEIRDLGADTLLGTSTVDIAVGGAVTVQAPWIPTAPDSHVISVEVSPLVLDESDYSNNTASRVVVLGTPLGASPGGVSSSLRFDPPHPNPTSRGIMFSFSLPHPSAASLHVFDILGRSIRSWSWTSLPAGKHSIEWDGHAATGERVATGVYLCRLEVGAERLQRKIVLRR